MFRIERKKTLCHDKPRKAWIASSQKTLLAMTASILVFFAITTSIANAMPDDRLQSIHITAHSSQYNYKTGINEFVGNVKADQGSTHLTADRLIAKTSPQHKIQEIIAYGIKERAHYWTKPKQTDPELHAQASIIKFYPQKSNITLEQVVLIKQGENSFQGELIHYNSILQTITVPKLDKSRAIIVYNPDK